MNIEFSLLKLKLQTVLMAFLALMMFFSPSNAEPPSHAVTIGPNDSRNNLDFGNRVCKVRSLRINTGLHPTTNTLIPANGTDPLWTAFEEDADDPATSEPRPAWVITRNTAWQPPLPNSMWVSSYPTDISSRNEFYKFRYCFCLSKKPSASLAIQLRADDRAEVYLNGSSLINTPDPSFNTPTPTEIKTEKLKAGRNCIEVWVKNEQGGAMGFNLAGLLVGRGINRPSCCDPNGSICGLKWHDQNGDGVRQSSESPLQGWTLNLIDADGDVVANTITDGTGHYCFMDVEPGTYKVREQVQSGWEQTFP